MRLATLRLADGSGTTAARLDGDTWRHLPHPDVGTLLAAQTQADGTDTGGRTPLEAACYAPLVPAPRALLCVGLNYRSHIAEMGRQPDEHPTVFAKLPHALLGADDDILLPPRVADLDWEAELAVVVGQPLNNADARTAHRAIAGYTVANDVTARDWQRHSSQWTLSKSLPRSTPLGPVLATPDECDDARGLRITCRVNGRLEQDGNTDDLLFTPADVLAYVSQLVPLSPGDTVLTGTPAGVGAGQQPPRRLNAGDTVVTEIEGLGACTNNVASAGGAW